MSPARRVTAIIPCYNRPTDLALLLGDLAGIERTGIDLIILIVDNGSEPPLPEPMPHPVAIECIRLSVNTGGSGGYNAGMAHALCSDESSAHTQSFHDPEFLWLIDSDARVQRSTLALLMESLDAHPELGIVGPLLADVNSQSDDQLAIHEIGGTVSRHDGTMGPAFERVPGQVVQCDYVAACCLLVRAEAVRQAGVFPPIFLNGDDSTWCIRLGQITGLKVGIEPRACAQHPRFDGFPTFARYYSARNAWEPMAALGLGSAARFRRGLIETGRAINLAMTGRTDLAGLHLRGLKDAAADRIMGAGHPGNFEPFVPMTDEVAAWPRVAARGSLRQTVVPLLQRVLWGPKLHHAVVPAKGHPSTWLCARTVALEHNGRVVIRRTSRFGVFSRIAIIGKACTIGAGCLLHTVRLAVRPPVATSLPTVRVARAITPMVRTPKLSLSVIVLSYNRKDALLHTLEQLRCGSVTAQAEIIVVDNASSDGTPVAVRDAHPQVRLLALDTNTLIEGFNIGVRAAKGDLVLILDDDARPDQPSLSEAMEALENNPRLGGATLMPIHPASGASEWPFVRTTTARSENWPVMGCCNLVRRELWIAAGGYDSSFELYRNDVELALRLQALGMGVAFDPRWTCEHDSPAAAHKSERWCYQATRNWIWMCRRHGRGASCVAMIVLGCMSAARHAGVRTAALRAVCRGVREGLGAVPEPPEWFKRDDRHLKRLLRLRLNREKSLG